MSKLTLYVVRHGKTMMNTLDKVQGWCDSPLTQEGIDVARYLGVGLKGVEFRSAYCSDLRRTRQTVQTILDAKGQADLPIVEMMGLREACFGSFEADFNYIMWNSAALYLQYTSLDAMYTDILDGKLNYGQVLDVIKLLDKMGMAESYEQVRIRTQESLNEIVKAELPQGSGNILIVSHGMSILAMLLSLGGDQLFTKPLDNAAVCKVVYEKGEFVVESMGDMSYVEKGKAEI